MKPLFMIDGRAFQSGVVTISRSAEIRDGDNSNTSLSGRSIRDLIGTYCHYTMELSALAMDVQEYDTLFELLSAPVESHKIQAPYGQAVLTYEAYITAVEDHIAVIEADGRILWDGLTVTFTAVEPQRLPGGNV